jgi:hypothetical protein
VRVSGPMEAVDMFSCGVYLPSGLTEILMNEWNKRRSLLFFD